MKPLLLLFYYYFIISIRKQNFYSLWDVNRKTNNSAKNKLLVISIYLWLI